MLKRASHPEMSAAMNMQCGVFVCDGRRKLDDALLDSLTCFSPSTLKNKMPKGIGKIPENGPFFLVCFSRLSFYIYWGKKMKIGFVLSL